MRAVILYKDVESSLLSRLFLKSGFHHCMVLLDDGQCWVSFDHTWGQPLLKVIAGSEVDIAAHYREEYIVQETEFERRETSRSTLGPHNCVGSIKRLLGIRPFWILTPHQLYRYLEKHDGQKGAFQP